ncbi:hypothetical protein COU17_01295 [Candidatus Kaiserbacteria bacterium CG10_big_fil_rev_8_21_14_0_10_49_17]|uniref:Uncharacterized protein n=1 Tax=Candidatus Kaiserbacteria bacterium CG10_big_fil_rev_8_21_14_0_10_49_17 TaxID=1974609 RepID=A0A2M6WES1_9BACT|nr:MAG: hypothetical protein COU17_01295 [Candidatus Kaiserbacteria bacterium CG10_big_fil_rev_8_21_14_0_10_49_17]
MLEKHALHLIEDNPRQGTVLLDVLEERFESRAAIARVAVDRDGRDELEVSTVTDLAVRRGGEEILRPQDAGLDLLLDSERNRLETVVGADDTHHFAGGVEDRHRLALHELKERLAVAGLDEALFVFRGVCAEVELVLRLDPRGETRVDEEHVALRTLIRPDEEEQVGLLLAGDALKRHPPDVGAGGAIRAVEAAVAAVIPQNEEGADKQCRSPAAQRVPRLNVDIGRETGSDTVGPAVVRQRTFGAKRTVERGSRIGAVLLSGHVRAVHSSLHFQKWRNTATNTKPRKY